MHLSDPYAGVPYSVIVERFAYARPNPYYERPRPIRRVPGTGQAQWDSTSGNWVV